MEFLITEYQHCNLIKIKGRIDSYSAPQIQEALNALIEDEKTNLIINMEKVTYISSSGILVFVNAHKKLLHKNRGQIVFACVPKLVFSGFELAGFNKIFEFYDELAPAIGRF